MSTNAGRGEETLDNGRSRQVVVYTGSVCNTPCMASLIQISLTQVFGPIHVRTKPVQADEPAHALSEQCVYALSEQCLYALIEQ